MIEITNDLIFRLILAGLATYRVGRMIAIDNGPFRIFYNMREWFYRKSQEQDIKRSASGKDECSRCGFWYESWLMLSCPCCLPSLLPALLFAKAVVNPSLFGDIMLMIFAVFGISVFMNFGFGVEDD